MKVSILEARKAKTFTVSFRGLNKEYLGELVLLFKRVIDKEESNESLEDLYLELMKELPSELIYKLLGSTD